jgi:hypothetical protein
MMRASISATARGLRAVAIWGLSWLVSAAAYAIAVPEAGPATSTAPPLTAPSAAPASTAAPASPSATVKPQNSGKQRWADLTAAQQYALAPLAGEWNELDAFRKNKWLAIGNKFASMKSDEQQRVQERMREWVKLTPEERRIARESYSRAKKLDPDQKSAQWEQYQQLPEEQKKKLAADAAAKKPVATLPRASALSPDTKTIAPIKSHPKPVLEQSVTPKAAAQSALQPSVPPAK